MTICSRCGASNPPANKFCGECGGALASAAASSSSTVATELPPWLRDDAHAPVTPAEPPRTPPQSELPAWLTDIGVEDEPHRGELPAAAPVWLAQIQDATPPNSAAPPSAEELPEWLRSVGADAQAPQAPVSSGDDLPTWLRDDDASLARPAPAPSTDDLPEWLRSIHGEAPAAATTTMGALPEWLRADASSQPQAIATAPTTTDALPEWLRTDEAEPAPGVTTLPHEAPPWLNAADQPPAEVSEPQAQTGVSSNELPAWLREQEPSAVSAQPSASTELPSWLTDFDTADSPSSSSALPPGRERPAWLDDEAESPALPEQPAPHTRRDASSDLPAWLGQDDAAAGAAPPASASATGGAAWLSADEHVSATPSTHVDTLPAWLDEPRTAATSDVEVNVPVPDWGSEFGRSSEAAAQAAAGSHDLPAWLVDAEDATQPSPAASSSSTTTDLPAWLVEESPTAAPPSLEPQQFVSAAPLPNTQGAELPSWLTDDAVATATSTNQSATAAGDVLPPWLMAEPREETTSAAHQPGADDPSATQALPAWLLDEPLHPEQLATETSATSTNAAEDMPEWLQSTEKPAGNQGTENLPPWLRSTEEPSAQQPAAGSPAWLGATDATTDNEPTEELPPWLRSAEAPVSERHTAEVYDVPADGTPAWLNTEAATTTPNTRQTDDTAALEHPASSQDARSADTVELPAWLADTPTAAPTASASTETDLPPWLAGMPEQPTTKPATNELPAWLEDTAEPVSPTGNTAGSQRQLMGGLDLPAWLRDEDAPPLPAQPVEAAPSWLRREEPEPEVAAPAVAVVEAPRAPRIVRSPERLASMQLLEQLMAESPAEPLPQPKVRRRSRALTIAIALATLLIVTALLAVLLSQRFGLSFGAVAAPAPAALAAAQVVSNLPANRPVMLAYEWDAQRLGELRPLEDTVVGQLASRKDVPLIFVSTDPQGALLASERAGQLDALNDRYHINGLGYANLGFKAGGPLALHRFAANASFGTLFAQDASGVDLRSNDVTMESMCGSATADGCSWDNVSLLVVMADDVDDVRGWFEQVRSEHPRLQTLLLTPAEIAPQIQPYAAVPGVAALAGLGDAAAYAQAVGTPSERLGRQLDATAIGGALFAIAVVVGGVPAWLIGWRQRRSQLDATEGPAWER